MIITIEALFIKDNNIAGESLDEWRQSPSELAVTGRHHNHYLWLLTQSYSAIPKDSRMQAEAMSIWYPKERPDLKMIHDENNFLTDDE